MEKLSRKVKLSNEAKILTSTIATGVVGGVIAGSIALANIGATDLTLASAGATALVTSAIALNVATKVNKESKEMAE